MLKNKQKPDENRKKNGENRKENVDKRKKYEKPQWTYEETDTTPRKIDENKKLNVSISDFDIIPNVSLLDDYYRYGIPRNVVRNISNIHQVNYLDHFKTSSIAIKVTQVHSPFKFWFTKDVDATKVSCLMENMQRYYKDLTFDENEQYTISEKLATEGRCCAALYDYIWHRAIILEDAALKKVTVMYFDIGTVATIPIEDIRFLLEEFVNKVPYVLMRGRLALVAPITDHWLINDECHSTDVLKDMILSKTLKATLYAYEESEQIFHLILHDSTKPDDPISINEQFAKMGQAYLLTQETEIWPHIDEVYPTFKMLETGEIPMDSTWDMDLSSVNIDGYFGAKYKHMKSEQRTVFGTFEEFFTPAYTSPSLDFQSLNPFSSLYLDANSDNKSEKRCMNKDQPIPNPFLVAVDSESSGLTSKLEVNPFEKEMNQFLPQEDVKEGALLESNPFKNESIQDSKIESNPFKTEMNPFLSEEESEVIDSAMNNPFKLQQNNPFFEETTNETTNNPFL